MERLTTTTIATRESICTFSISSALMCLKPDQLFAPAVATSAHLLLPILTSLDM